MLVSDAAPCAVRQTHTVSDGSFRFSSVRAGEYRAAVIGLAAAYGIKAMTAGGASDLLFNPMRVIATASTNILIEIARLEEIRGDKSSVVHVVDRMGSQCLIHQVQPVDPSQAKAAGIVGNVIMSVGVDKNGYVEDVMVVQGHPLLIQLAIDAVRRWRYAPFVFLGTTVPLKTTVVIPFGLK
jgi:TonB family protein